MADEENAQQEGGGKKKSKLKLIIILLVVLIILGGGGFGAYMFLFKEKPAENPSAQQNEQVPTNEPQQIGELYPFDSFIVNLADPGGSRYLRVTLQVELGQSKELKEEMDARKPQLRDAILTILSSKRFEEVNSSQGKMILKQQITRRLNSLLTKGQVLNVYLTEFVVQ
ncbi:flagellar basal body-associated FliL family protein [Limisalsivibrio acetivorans]|uniref:flagellar basal body-associated FliL family protein n=1 Tax=Limisalsivibrio acetivorans TaxID=1304888 RepID=UPI0003B42FAE|nr:flagellar basal body-associated FliL family protein [Limisalsivibrio acetivorans]